MQAAVDAAAAKIKSGELVVHDYMSDNTCPAARSKNDGDNRRGAAGNCRPGRRPQWRALCHRIAGISKAFGPVQANKDISIRSPGTIHGIIGENGAGKSTLMSILYGFYKADSGEIFIGGATHRHPRQPGAIRAGIGMVFQHFKLVQNFTVLENVILGAEEGALLRPVAGQGAAGSEIAGDRI
jgi:ABC-type multidrug transport system fused ATPase/permease subunit